MSGNRWSARLKRRARLLHENARLIDRAIDQGLGKLNRHARRCRRQRVADRSGGHADRAEIVSLAVRGMLLGLAIVGSRDGRHNRAVPGAGPVQRVNVAESQGKVDGQRDEREP